MGQAFRCDPKNEGVEFMEPIPLDCTSIGDNCSTMPQSGPLNVVCVKYGTKYGADYVNKLYWGVKKHLSILHTFSCFTEDADGLDENILVKPLRHKWQGWWSKVHIFDPSMYQEENASDWVFYIDLDMIITGSLDDLVSMIGSKVTSFATLSTDEIFCENVDNGYNSSVMLF